VMRERCIFLLLPRFVLNILVKQQEDEQEYESDWFDERKLFDMLEFGTQLSWQCNLLIYIIGKVVLDVAILSNLPIVSDI